MGRLTSESGGLSLLATGDPRDIRIAPLVGQADCGFLLGTELRVEDSFRTTLTWRWAVKGKAVLAALDSNPDSLTSELVLLPVIQRGPAVHPDFPGFVVEVNVASSIRLAQPVPEYARDLLAADYGPADYIRSCLCIYVSVEELRLNPIISIVQTTGEFLEVAEDEENDADDSSTARPVGTIEFPLEGLIDESRPISLTIEVPDAVESDGALAVGHLAFGDDYLFDDVQPAVDTGAFLLALRNLHATGSAVSASLAAYGLEDLLPAKANSTIEALQETIQKWIDEFHHGRFESRGDGHPDTEAAVHAAMDELRRIVDRASSLKVGLLLKPNDVGLHEVGANKSEVLHLEKVVVSYSGKNLSAQRRPGYLLLLIFLLEVALAARLTGSIRIWEASSWFTFDEAVAILAANREVLIALQLLFPGAMYAEAIRKRPRTAVSRRAQLRFNSLLTFGFVAPLVPAVLAVGIEEPWLVSASLFMTGAIAAVLAALTFLWTMPHALAAARLRQLVKVV